MLVLVLHSATTTGGWRGCSLCSGAGPVVRSWDRQRYCVGDVRRDDHGLVARQDGLAKRHDGSGLVHGLDGPRTVHAIGLAVERLLGRSTVAIQSAVLENSSILRSGYPDTQQKPRTIDSG